VIGVAVPVKRCGKAHERQRASFARLSISAVRRAS
jgi:hypothetical protein